MKISHLPKLGTLPKLGALPLWEDIKMDLKK
jgi:hypothetical protein